MDVHVELVLHYQNGGSAGTAEELAHRKQHRVFVDSRSFQQGGIHVQGSVGG